MNQHEFKVGDKAICIKEVEPTSYTAKKGQIATVKSAPNDSGNIQFNEIFHENLDANGKLVQSTPFYYHANWKLYIEEDIEPAKYEPSTGWNF